ncbi:hypothetical protein [Endozoicomonas sp. 8E]|uniref:hypothetical protein n=1 Tax=Endozoicomonas sp. 8E TaxID=3035692 RepID=UPI0029392E0C|nr:hypothetical protein [Endozoicomonas sp. 8E]WOG28832.1 hypothetical protein P6910_04000 [Endozoicomonas sp. 8E]
MALDSRLRGNDDLRAWEPEFCDNRLRGNDDLRAWERAVGVLRQPRMTGVKPGMMVVAAYLNGTYDQFKGQIVR